MARSNRPNTDDKKFIIATISRSDVRMLFGDTLANSLTNADLERIAREMCEQYMGDPFVKDLQDVLRYKFDLEPRLVEGD